MASCFFCGLDDCALCELCGLVGVCNKHARIHRPEQECMPFKVENQPGKGNFLVATRDIKPFQVVLQDEPAIIGPFDDCELQCLSCSAPMDEYNACSICSLPVCNPECEKGWRHRSECKYFAHSNIPHKDTDINVLYSAIAPVRMMDVKETKMEVWGLVDRLEDHLEERQKRPQWSYLTDKVFPFLEKHSSLGGNIAVLERIVGIFRTNSVKWEEKGVSIGHALCPVFSLLCHSCVNNTRYVTDNNKITVRACLPIMKGEEITSQYRSPNEGNILRRRDFIKNWLFDCSCPRCQDPTELGTNACTLKCMQCCKPTLLPRTSSLESDWECRSCGFNITHQTALQITVGMNVKFLNKSYGDSLQSWEDFLDEISEVSHPNNFICMKTKRIILQIYGSRTGSTLSELKMHELQRKIELCRNYIEVFSVLEPGYRVWKGRVLEEMLGPLSIIVQKRMESGEMGKLEYMLKYKEIITIIREASKCRQFLVRDNETDSKMAEFYGKWVEPLANIVNS